MANSIYSIEQMETTPIKNPAWWKRRSTLERRLIVVVVTWVLLCAAFGIGIAVIALKPGCPPKTCLTDSCIHTASKVLKNMNKSVDPCDNFYRFACGQFLKTTIIPDDTESVDIFTEASDHIREQLRIIMEEPSLPNEPKPFKLAKNLYKSCMNTTEIEKQGVDPLLQIFKKLGGWPVLEGETWKEDEFDWRNSTFILREMGYSADYFLKFSVGFIVANGEKLGIILDQAYLGLSREYLLQGINDTIVKAYYNYMVDIATILGVNRHFDKNELMDSLKFEMQLANISLSQETRRNETLLFNPMTIAELNRNYPFINWMEYFSKLLPPDIRVKEDVWSLVRVPAYIRDLGELMNKTPKRVQANYIMWRAAKASVRYLNEDVRKRQLTYSTAVIGITERESRWKECVDVVAEKLSVSVSALYVRKYFNKDSKKNAEEIVDDIRVQFYEILNDADWIDKVTKKSALEKAASMATHIAYPDELLDDEKLEEFYDNIEISENNYLQNILNLSRFSVVPVKPDHWMWHSQSAVVNAFYSNDNSIQFPAGILQGAFFSNDRPRYMNYGAIGSVIGHEITHGFDDQGRQFDKKGNLVDWWTPSTKEKYLEKAECIINQYGNYTVEEVGLQLNGINTQGENIADNGGIKEAYWAYRDWSDRNAPEGRLPGLDQYSPRQMFWISFANTYCTAYRPNALKSLVKTDVHSPEEFRIIGSVSNMKEFAEDFQCPVGSKMNPRKKCFMW